MKEKKIKVKKWMLLRLIKKQIKILKSWKYLFQTNAENMEKKD